MDRKERWFLAIALICVAAILVSYAFPIGGHLGHITNTFKLIFMELLVYFLSVIHSRDKTIEKLWMHARGQVIILGAAVVGLVLVLILYGKLPFDAIHIPSILTVTWTGMLLGRIHSMVIRRDGRLGVLFVISAVLCIAGAGIIGSFLYLPQ